jgi:hypothetical protein
LAGFVRHGWISLAVWANYLGLLLASLSTHEGGAAHWLADGHERCVCRRAIDALTHLDFLFLVIGKHLLINKLLKPLLFLQLDLLAGAGLLENSHI